MDLLRLDDKDISLAILGGMSGVFASLFGTPVTSVFFALEVISVGVIYYSGLVPCLVSSLTAYGISSLFSMGQEIDVVISVPDYSILSILKVALIGVCCAVVSIMFIQGMDHVRHFFEHHIKNAYIKILVGSEGFVFFAIACCISYMLSGYYGLYGSQKIMYSKLKAEYINIRAK